MKIALAGLLVLVIIASIVPHVGTNRSPQENLALYQAYAFLHGRVDLDPEMTVGHGDRAYHEGKIYSPFPPWPAVLLMPFVAVLGIENTNTTVISIVLSAMNVMVLRRILKRLDVNPKTIPWILAAFFLGTGYWFAVKSSSGVWFFDHILAVTAMLLAINEMLGKGRAAIVGLFVGLAFLSRQMSLYSLVFLAVGLWENPHAQHPKSRLMRLAAMLGVFSVCAAAYLVFNSLRFGSVFDAGYDYLAYSGAVKERFDTYGLFHPAYIPFNFAYMFLQGFHLSFDPGNMITFKQLAMDPYGVSITFASPFVFFAFWAKWKTRLTAAAWISIALMLAHSLMYMNNGYSQVNTQRFTLDFLPILILLVALAANRLPPSLVKVAILYAVILNALALYLITNLYAMLAALA